MRPPYLVSIVTALLTQGACGHRKSPEYCCHSKNQTNSGFSLPEIHGILLVNGTETPEWKYVRYGPTRSHRS
jgi:hypothetical protein